MYFLLCFLTFFFLSKSHFLNGAKYTKQRRPLLKQYYIERNGYRKKPFFSFFFSWKISIIYNFLNNPHKAIFKDVTSNNFIIFNIYI